MGEPQRANGDRRWLRRVSAPAVAAIAAAWFLVDAVFYSVIHPLAMRVARLPAFAALGAWVRGLGPYTTLALFLVPVVVFEPLKPVALYLAATGHVVDGALLLAVGETAKVLIVERLFHVGRDKLMTIPAFAWSHRFAMRWIDWLTSLPPWQAVRRCVRALRARARIVAMRLRARIATWRAN